MRGWIDGFKASTGCKLPNMWRHEEERVCGHNLKATGYVNCSHVDGKFPELPVKIDILFLPRESATEKITLR